MTSRTDWLFRFYRWVLRLYPPDFRQEYQQEMLAVFGMQVSREHVSSFWGAVIICWRELRDLPGMLLAAHLRERGQKMMQTSFGRWFSPSQGSRKELLLASLPYLFMAFLPGFLSLFLAPSDDVNIGGLVLLAGLAFLLILLGIIGFIVRMPRWSLVYAGIFLILVTFGALVLLVNLEIIPSYGWNTFAFTAVFLGLYVIMLFLALALVGWLSGKFHLVSEFSQQVKADPTLISFMLYSGTLVIVLANFEDVSSANWYLMLAAVSMILGAWGFLQQNSTRYRMWSLFWGNTLAMAFSLAANLLLVDYGLPPAIYLGTITIDRAVIFISLTWITSLVMIFFPLAFGFLGRKAALA